MYEKGWNPTRERQFNWQILQLVGPPDQWDITLKAVAKRAGTDLAVTQHELIPTSIEILGWVMSVLTSLMTMFFLKDHW